MVHSKVPAEQVADYTGGWKSAYWDPLKEYLAEKAESLRSRQEEEQKEIGALSRRPRPRSRCGPMVMNVE